jgi:signal transduction histidine kinase
MGNEGKDEAATSARLTEMVVRTLRHEVGDLLQSVYSAVAILQERVPPTQTLERTILADLRHRAEVCKNELDAAHDLVCPVTLNLAPIDLTELANSVVAACAPRFTALEIHRDCTRPLPVQADGQRLAHAGALLMLSACQTARSKVWVRTALRPEGSQAEWSITHDGPDGTDEQLSWLTAPFNTTRHARLGLGLALAHRVAKLHGGDVAADNLPEGGFRVRLVLPLSSLPG